MTLFINTCVRNESRTRILAQRLISEMKEPVEEVCPGKINFPKTDEEFINNRDRLILEGDFKNPAFDLAQQFAAADDIVIAAPYWDLSFPASLKQYIEHINVAGITFCYTPEGEVKGLCRAQSLTYITTAGGHIIPEEYGFGYIKALAQNFYGIENVRLIKAVGLDEDGADVKAILDSVQILP